MISYYKHGMTVIIRDQKLILMYDRLKSSYQLVGHKQYTAQDSYNLSGQSSSTSWLYLPNQNCCVL